VAKKIRYSAIDGRTTRHSTYEVSQRMRKRVEEIFAQPHCVDSVREPSTSFLTPRRCYLSYLFQNKLLQVVLEAESWLRRVGIAPTFSAEDRMNFMRGFSAAC